ncbi:MAG: hydroxymethylbilane synthase [Thermoguttaceae bacterium]|nr:hydroxymethylbilane synthase [Thermoguttaceae bacterium]MDW8078205.1 hydroxymethylbilane synthase [Thermoguttaceae bacterium]
MHIRIGTRGSQLARSQTAQVAQLLADLGAAVQLVLITTTGDRQQEGAPPLGESRGIFTKELQDALLDGRVDIAVHSLKDLPTEPVAGLRLAAVLARESPFDVLVCPRAEGLSVLASPVVVGTTSPRRRAQLWYLYPHLRIEPLRGNVDTRLRKLREGQFDAIVLAEAGLQRLNRLTSDCHRLPGAFMLPAPGQGALAVEVRTDDPDLVRLVGRLDHYPTRAAVEAERSFLRYLKGGCLAPVAALGMIRNERLVLAGRVLSPDGRRRLDATQSDSPQNADLLGEKLATQLLGMGAGECIALARSRPMGLPSD